MNKEKQVYYSPIFWKFFWLTAPLVLLSRSIGLAEQAELTRSDYGVLLWLNIALSVGSMIYIYFFCKMINEAMLSIDKKNWWPLGLLAFIPFGFWVAFLITKGQLKPQGKWVEKGKEDKSFKLTK